MFSEGADTKASTGLLNPLWRLFIVVLDRNHTTRKTETKSSEYKTSSFPELIHIFMEEHTTQTHALFHFTLHLSLPSVLSIVKL